MPKLDKNTVQKEIIYSQLTENDLDKLSDLILGMRKDDLNTLNTRSVTKKYYDWIYFKNPRGKAIIFKGMHNNKLVCSFAIAPKLMLIGGKQVLAGKTMDMFTHPDYQGLGLMKKATNLVFEQTKKENIYPWYVTPSVNSYPIFKNKWKYSECFRVLYRTKLLKTTPILKRMLKPALLGNIAGSILDIILAVIQKNNFKLPEDYRIETVKKFSTETDELWQKSQKNDNMLIRDARYLNWRYVENPDDYIKWHMYKQKQLCGMIILKTTIRKHQQIGEIVDFLYLQDQHELLVFMLKKAVRFFKENNCVFVQGWAIENSDLDKLHKKAGLSWGRTEIKVLLTPDEKDKKFYDKNAWYLSQGDGNDI